MAAPLTTCTNEEHDLILWSEDVKINERYERITVQHWNNCMNLRKAYK
jgi:hypothetical protein